ncbi:MAG TPA: DUF3536 domain-containing protein [Thermoanaerobaculia bacterium]|nr:DUF3536 domain-containing protein [Thermoanaerobaculia bacterium]
MNRYLCIHGHFYQPPRENPWLEAIEVQDSAAPYHDWNERITAECYAPNTAARILQDDREIAQIVNNYSQISFNFGPTLMAWLEARQPEVYAAIQDADRQSRARFSGHGSAMAQAYNHSILPLSNRRDKLTQIRWGLADFERRFGRKAEGMWLPETAVDMETLDLLASEGVRFTVLAPHQARRVRAVGAADWHDVSGGHVDTTVPYWCKLYSGRRIALFFYEGGTSRAVAFEGLLTSGERFASRLLAGVPERPDRPRLAHIATDGETYGHHHRLGEMALAYALHHIESHGLARLTNYGEMLALHPPEQEAEIFENTSWSCAHGVERWRGDCGCHTGGRAGWNQAWRAPLREALDWLRDELAPRFGAAAAELFADPWAARDDYISVLLDRSPENVAAFLERHAAPGADFQDPAVRTRALKLMELQRQALLMYTSCGWFFNDLGGIETVQVLCYAGRVVQLAELLFGDSVEEGFLERLERAKSNEPAVGTGRDLYEREVRPSIVDLRKVAAHYAVSSLFHKYPSPARVYCYEVVSEDSRTFQVGRARLAAGRVRIYSAITGSSEVLIYAVLHFGDQNLNAGVRPPESPDDLERLLSAAGPVFERGDFAQVIRILDAHFSNVSYSLKSLFRDEQRRVLELVLASNLDEAEDELREIFWHSSPLMRFLKDLGTPAPKVFRAAAEIVVNSDLRRALSDEEVDPEEVRRLLRQAGDLGLDLEKDGLGYALENTLDAQVRRLRQRPDDSDLLRKVESTVALARSVPFTVDLWRVQNRYYEILQTEYPRRLKQAKAGEDGAREWVERFRSLGQGLSVRVP